MKFKNLNDIEVINYHILLNMYCNCEETLENKIKEYVRHYCKLKGIYEPENSYLLLSFPTGKNKEQERKLFYDSPAMFSENFEFEGVFAIYLPNNINENEMEELIKYVYENKSKIHFIFITTIHSEHTLNQMHCRFSNIINIKTINELENSSEELYKKLNVDVDEKYFKYLLKNTKLNLDEIKFKIIHEKHQVIKNKNKLMF